MHKKVVSVDSKRSMTQSYPDVYQQTVCQTNHLFEKLLSIRFFLRKLSQIFDYDAGDDCDGDDFKSDICCGDYDG